MPLAQPVMPSEQAQRPRHVLSPSERWKQLRRAKPPVGYPTQRAPPRSTYRDRLLYITLLLPVLILLPLYLNYPDILVTPPPPPLRRYALRLPLFPESVANLSKPATLVLSAGHPHEYIAIYRPLVLTELKRPLQRRYVSAVTVMVNHTTSCTNFARNTTLRATACRSLVNSLPHADPELAHGRIANDSHLVGLPKSCTQASMVILQLSLADISLRRLLQRLLLAHTVLERVYRAP
eukprot:IDg1225t1